MLSSITINNFECFDEQNYKIDFSKLNIIVGPNNSGKSAIFKALNLVRFYAVNPMQEPPYWNTDYYNLQNFGMVVYNHDVSQKMQIVIEYSSNGDKTTAQFEYQDGYQNLKLSQDESVWSTLQKQEHANLATKVWYISSSRGSIPYRSQVGAIEADKLQPIKPGCENIVQYLLERYNARDENWPEFEKWMSKIDPQIKLFKTSLMKVFSSLETDRNDGKNTTNVNLSLQGSGIQAVIPIIAAIIFSPKDHTIIIEEPENFLHSKTIETLVDLFNHAVNNLSKQIIVITHSWDILRQYISDIGEGTDRGRGHEKANAADFKLITFDAKLGPEKIKTYDLPNKKFTEVVSDFKALWG